MPNVIPSELKNRRGLQKLKDFYAEQLKAAAGDENAPSLKQLRSDIKAIEAELVGKLVPMVSAARK